MIVVDSSVWIDFLNGRNAPHVRRLRAILGIDEVIVGDLMLCEVLQGLESEQAARDVEAIFRRFQIDRTGKTTNAIPMLNWSSKKITTNPGIEPPVLTEKSSEGSRVRLNKTAASPR